jgi:hypothetical protein
MDLKYFTQLLKNNNSEHNHYETIFDILSYENTTLNNQDRNELFSIIYDYEFFNYNYTWQLKSNEDLLHNLNNFHLNNFSLHH